MKDSHEKLAGLLSLCKRRGFIFPGSEIYGGLANSWDYGPLGAELKNNIKKLWWKMFVQERDDMLGLDSAIIMNPKVWQATKHVDTFHDPLVECKKCHTRLRADHIIDGKCPNCGGHEFGEEKNFNLMFKTNLGPSEDSSSEVYLRPETAQGIFVNFKNIIDSSRVKIPFGVAQIGKAFRNEITPGNFIFRTREFEQMEIEYFIRPTDWQQSFEHWVGEMEKWNKAIGLPDSSVHKLEVAREDLAHYSDRTIDFEFDYPFGRKELYGLAYRRDFDLKSHQDASGENLEFHDQISGERFLPHVIEPSFGVDRTLLAVLLSAYQEVEARSGDDEAVHEKEVVLRLPAALAPIKAAILPLSKKEPLMSIAKELATKLRKHYAVQYDESASIGKRYRRQDEIGTPLCITVDFETPNDNAVTIRDRDTMQQERISLDAVLSYITQKINND